ncbi:hypothetical protein [Psychrobacter pulmonis]|uniref:hypothetical protein n=1 Tax=Psychrobacter pulmonis TaxID=228654 RepID=UPI00191826E6|nr:hypothetical protein [Psychrobacter pulmonis]
MNKILCFVLATTCSFPALAGQLDSFISSVAIPENVEYNVNGWESIDDIEGVDWSWPYYEVGKHDYIMIGTGQLGNNRNPNIGAMDIRVEGTRTFFNSVYIVISNGGFPTSKSSLNRLFGRGIVEEVRSKCNESFGYTGSNATYSFKRKGYNPVFIRYGYSEGSAMFATDIKLSNLLYNLTDDCYN